MQTGGVDGHATVSLLDQPGHFGAGELIQHIRIGGMDPGGPRQRFLDSRIHERQLRQHVVPDAVPHHRHVIVGGVFPPGLALGDEPLPQLLSAHLQQGADAMARARRHASQAPRTAPRASRSSTVSAWSPRVCASATLWAPSTAERVTIEIKPGVAAGDLQRLPRLPGQGGHVGMGDVARQVEPECQSLHKRAIIVGRAAADVVMEVGDAREPQVSLGGQGAQGQQQGNRVGTA